jgi:hypothetical protein
LALRFDAAHQVFKECFDCGCLGRSFLQSQHMLVALFFLRGQR